MGVQEQGQKKVERYYCEWCGKKTTSKVYQLPDIPILEWIEIEIDKKGREKIWNNNSDWSKINLDPVFEAELMVYDKLLQNFTKKHICDKCIEQDNEMYDKYYKNGETDYIILEDE